MTEPQGIPYSAGSGPQSLPPTTYYIHSDEMKLMHKNHSNHLADETLQRPEHYFPVGKLLGTPTHLQVLWSMEAKPGAASFMISMFSDIGFP